jgi:hypothetical protein
VRFGYAIFRWTYTLERAIAAGVHPMAVILIVEDDESIRDLVELIRDRLKIGGQAAIAIDGDDSLVGWNVCP